jgi:hypothetical protein
MTDKENLELVFQNKYLKYKKKYLDLKMKQQEGGVISPGIYFIFYSNANSGCDLSKYKIGDTFPNFQELTKILGPITYSLQNNSSELTYVSLEGIFYKNLMKNFSIHKYSPMIKYSLKNKFNIKVKSGEKEFDAFIDKLLNNLTIKIEPKDMLQVNSFYRTGLTTFQLDKDFFMKNQNKIKNIMTKIHNNLKFTEIDSLVVLDVGVNRNSFVGYTSFSNDKTFMKNNKEFDFSEYENYKDVQEKYLSIVSEYTQIMASDIQLAVSNESSDDEIFKIYSTTADKLHRLSKELVRWKIINKM